MVDLKLLASRGIDAKGLKAKLAMPDGSGEPAKDDQTEAGKLSRLRNRIRLRTMAGRENNIRNYKPYFGLDRAWDLSQRQLNPTLLQTLLDSKSDDASVHNQLKSWGFDLNEVISETIDPKTGKSTKRLNVPAFFSIAVPLIKSYVTIRWAKIMMNNRISPFFRFEPAVNDMATRMKCEAITSRVQVMAVQYGYWNVLKQMTFNMLHYGICLSFPVEEWHWEEQELGPIAGAPPDETAEIPTEETVKESRVMRVTKEGLRYHIPHPTRTFYDESHRLSTFNTDTGCEFAGYWRVMRYRDVAYNNAYYNTDKISMGSTDWWSSASTFFQRVMGGCVISVPTPSVSVVQTSTDRETRMSESFYSKSNDDQSVLITEYFEKLVPSENGLGDYDGPVWFRFVIASTDTILYASPLAYSPILQCTYDADENRDYNASMSMEILPFQDQVSNLMSQFLLSVKQNLANATFVDTNVVGKDWVDTVRNWGEKMWRVINFIPYDSKKLNRAQLGVQQAFFSHNFPKMNTTEIIGAVRMMLDILERVLVMSSQEVAQAASHELREKEVVNIHNAASVRLAFTQTSIEDLRETWKRQIYLALMAYGQDEFYVNVPTDEKLTPEMLNKMGFTWNEDDGPMHPSDKSFRIKADKSAILLESFATDADGQSRSDNRENVAQLANALSGWMASPILGPAIGPDQGIKFANIIAKMAGFPREFRLENAAGSSALQEELGKFMGQIQEKLMGEIQQGLKPMMDLDIQQQQQIEALQAAMGMPPSPNASLPPATAPVQQGAGTPPMAPPAGGRPFP